MNTKVLIVEDEAIIAMLYKKVLTRNKFEVAGIADTGEKAIEMAEQVQPDIVLMDIKLKGWMDGIEAVMKIKEKFTIPIIYITGNTDEKTKSRALATNPLSYLEKPVDFIELCKIIRKGLG